MNIIAIQATQQVYIMTRGGGDGLLLKDEILGLSEVHLMRLRLRE